MGWIVLTVVLFIFAFAALGFCNNFDGREPAWRLNVKQLLAFATLGILLFGTFKIIPANHVGILYNQFTGTKEETLPEGLSRKSIFDKVYEISTEVQTMSISGLTTQTKDAQFVSTSIDIKYRVNSENAYLIFRQYKTLKNASDTLIVPTTQRVLELVTTSYNVIDVLGEKRGEIYSQLSKMLAEEFAQYGIEFYAIAIADMDAGEAIENAITQEAVAKKAVETAEQELLKAQTEAKQQAVNAQAAQDAAKIQAETKVIQAEADAKIKLIEAQAEADAKIVAAEAEQQANELISDSLTDALLQHEWTQKWSGNYPNVLSGDASNMLFDVSGFVAK